MKLGFPFKFLTSVRSFYWIITIYAIVAVFFIFQLGLTEQEAYYWLWAKNPDWSYFDHPPLQAWFTAILTFLFGDEKWVVRLPAFLGDLAVLALFYRWIKFKWGVKTAELCALLLMSSSAFMMGSVIALPDSLAVPLALASILCAQMGYLKRAAVFLGLALLGKWTVLFAAPGIIYSLYRQGKLQLRSAAVFSGIVLFFQTPVIWWNLNHANVSAKFHLYGRHAHEWLSLGKYFENVFNFFLAQVFSLGIMTSLIIFYLWFHRRELRLPSKEQWHSLFFWTFPGLLIVFVSALQGQIRFYWTFLSLLPVIAWVGLILTNNFPNALPKIRQIIVIVLMVQWGFGWLAGFYPVGTAIESALHLKPDLRRSPMGEFNGWSQWYHGTLAPTGLLDDQTALLGSDLHVAARLSWTLRKQRDLSSIGVVGLAKNQFQFWSQPEPPRFQKAVFFADNRYDHLDDLEDMCGHKVQWQVTAATAFNRPIKEIYWAYCESLRPSWAAAN